MTVRIVRNAAGITAAREAGAYGLLNFGFAVEGAWKADAVVRGGHRSFMTDLTKSGTPRVGGTFRRSIHTAASGGSAPVSTAIRSSAVPVGT